MARRSSIAIACRNVCTLGFCSVNASSSSDGQYSRSGRGTITEATVSQTPTKRMVGQRVEVMRANCAALSNADCGSASSAVATSVNDFRLARSFGASSEENCL
jgi:hypothetical protein